MGGIAFLFIVAIYVATAILVLRRIPALWGKVLATIAVIFLPTADALWGRYVTLPELCKDAGLTVFKKAAKGGGLMAWNPEDYWIRTVGIAFVEAELHGRYSRVSIIEGKPLLELDVIPKSRYRLSEERRLTSPFGDNYVGSEIRIDDRTSGEVISQYRGYRFNGGWVERFLGSFADSGPQGGAYCPPTVDRLNVLVRHTFN